MADNEFERIQPASLDIAGAQPAAVGHRIPVAREARPVNAATLAIALLVLLAAGVVFVLPRYVAEVPPPPSPNTDAAAQATTPAAGAGTANPHSASAPWQEAQRQRERASAKAALDALLALQYELQERRVEVWAPAEFAQATALAEQGDEAWRGDRYPEAEQAWRSGEQQLRALQEGIGARLEARLATGAAAFTAGDAPAAVAAYAEALAIDPDSSAAQQGLTRAGHLEQLQQLLAAGASAEAAGQHAAALARYREALAVDAAWPPAQQALAALQQRVAADQAAVQVSAGYAALAAGRIDEARRAFQGALKLGAGAPARDGLQQAEFQGSQRRIAELLASAASAAQAERWQDALAASKAALAIDASLAPARAAREQATTRLALDAALEKIARDPASLTTEQGRGAADKLLAAAAAIPEPGPRLTAQMAAARARLAEMRTPVAVLLRSDGATEVTVFRVGALGRFAENRVELLPGDYVAVGRRDGYRDVRVAFSVRAGTAAKPVMVQCRQKI